MTKSLITKKLCIDCGNTMTTNSHDMCDDCVDRFHGILLDEWLMGAVTTVVEDLNFEPKPCVHCGAITEDCYAVCDDCFKKSVAEENLLQEAN